MSSVDGEMPQRLALNSAIICLSFGAGGCEIAVWYTRGATEIWGPLSMILIRISGIRGREGVILEGGIELRMVQNCQCSSIS